MGLNLKEIPQGDQKRGVRNCASRFTINIQCGKDTRQTGLGEVGQPRLWLVMWLWLESAKKMGEGRESATRGAGNEKQKAV